MSGLEMLDRTAIDLARIDSAAQDLERRIAQDRAILDALRRAQALAMEAWERGFAAGLEMALHRDGRMRPENPYR